MATLGISSEWSLVLKDVQCKSCARSADTLKLQAPAAKKRSPQSEVVEPLGGLNPLSLRSSVFRFLDTNPAATEPFSGRQPGLLIPINRQHGHKYAVQRPFLGSQLQAATHS